MTDVQSASMVEPVATRPPQPADGRSPGAPPSAGATGLELLPSTVALGLLIIALGSNGAFAVHSWAPLCVVALALLAFSPLRRVRGPALVALVAAWAFAGWTALSLLWTESPGAAVEGAARAVLYAALFTVPVTTLPDRRSARRFAVLVAAALAGLVVVTFVLVAIRGDELFLAGRLDSPIGYRNGTAALFVLAFWPLLCAAAARQVAVGWRAGAMATGMVALSLAFLTQSRGALIGFLAGAAVVMLVGPDRLRRAWLIVAAASLLAVFSDPLLAPYDAFVDGIDPGSAVAEATRATAALAIIAAVGMLFVAVCDRGLRGSDAARRRLRTGGAVALAAGTLVAIVAALAVIGNPVDYANDRIDEFRSLESPAPGETRFGTTGGQRYDLWRIAVNQFADNPVAGAGEGSYPFAYYRDRRTDRNLNHPHSLPLRVASELGIVGFAVLLAWILAAGVAVARASVSTPERRWLAATAGIGATFFAQTAVDWLWLIPGVAGVAAVATGLAVALAQPDGTGEAPGRRRGAVAARIGWGLAAVAVACFYLSDYEVREARAAGARGAPEQLEAAERAQSLNPFALAPRLLQAGALEDLGRRDEARQTLDDALELERSFVVMALIGDLELRAGNEAQARRWYRRALAENPGDVGLQRLAAGDHG